MSEQKSMGPLLRHLSANGGGTVQVTLRTMDWETRKIGSGPQAGLAVGNSLVAFEATSFSEVKDMDVWDFVVEDQVPDAGGPRTVRAHLYLLGSDILFVRQVSPVQALT